MSLPIQAPQIRPDIIQGQEGQGLLPIIEALTQQRLVNAQLDNYRSITEQRQQEAAALAQAAQDRAKASEAFYQHLSGSAVRLKPTPEGQPPAQGVDPQTGMLTPLPQFERGLSPGAHALYMQMIAGHNATVQEGLEGARTQVATEHDRALTALAMAQNDAALRKAADDAATKNVLAKWGPQLQTEPGQRGAIRDVLTTVGPDAADQVARALNVGVGRYGHVVGPDGFLYITDSKTGAVRRDATVGMKANTLGQERLDAIRRNAGTIVDLLDAQEQIIRGTGLQGSKNPALAQMLQDSRILGISTAALSNLFRNDPQQATQMLRTRFSHNYIGMLPNSRSAAQLLENLSQSYWPPSGSGDAVLRRAEADRQRLRAIMAGVRDGQITDLSKIPGFSAAASAAALEGQATPTTGVSDQAPINPDDFLHPIP